MPKVNKDGELLANDKGAQMNTMTKIEDVAAQVAKGAPKQQVIQYIKDKWHLSDTAAREYYMAGCHHLRPKDPEKYRESLIQNNIARLEKIIDEGLKDNANLRIAKEAIAELNKMLGITGNNSVTIKQNPEEKTQEIQINFN